MTKNSKQRIVVIVGPTASGKTSLSLELAKIFNGEIISADSCQIYRGMNIGTAKATKDELNIVKHYLVGIKNPDENYSAGQFKKDALGAIHKIIKVQKLPIIVGGTGLYISAIVNNLDFPRVSENRKLRQQLEKEIEEKGIEHVFNKLVELDPEAIYIVDPKNPRRIIRALEIAMATGKPFTARRKKGKPLFRCLQIGITKPPLILKDRIAKRINQMIGNGLVNEVEELTKKYGYNIKAFDAIGYREIIDYLKGKCRLDQATQQMITNTWHYAKRQMTWFKKDKDIHWVKTSAEAEKLVKKFLK